MIRGLLYRRHQLQKRKKRYLTRDYFICEYWQERPSLKRAGIMAKTPVRCSCKACGNPRRHFGKKHLNEIKHDLVVQDELNETEKDFTDFVASFSQSQYWWEDVGQWLWHGELGCPRENWFLYDWKCWECFDDGSWNEYECECQFFMRFK